MKVLSLFSGVGGFDLGLERAGMETVFQCEWDKHATKILEKHWPHVPRWDDVSTLTGEHILAHAPVIDVVAWGSPCQDLSVAGKRAGLQGARSGLFHEGVRIIKELRELTNGKYPRISIWENVAGALSSGKGADFGQVLTEMDEAGACFSEWRILDAQYFGVPQRRRRVFLISVFDSATAARCPDPLLPVSESVRRNTQAGAETREEPASETPAGSRGGGDDVAGSLTWRMKNGYNGQDAHSNLLQVVNNARPVGTAVLGSEIVANLAASDFKWPQNQQLEENKFVVETFTGSEFAQYKEGVGTVRANGGDLGGGSETLVTFTKGKRAQTADDDETWDENRPAPTINAFDQGDTPATTVIVQDPILLTMREAKPGGGKGPLLSTDKSLSLSTSNEQLLFTPAAIPIQDGRDIEKHQNGLGVAEEGAPSYTIDQTDAQAVAYSFDSLASNSMKSSNPDSGCREVDVAKTLDTARPDPSCNQGGIAVVQPTMAVRRLTPLECERLMGWPDDWTAGQPDTHRYKQCGNGVASPVATWIGERLMELDQ